ncbi:MAG: hypothetical protein JRN35_07825 [Nitrososphaerota archaeon]|jgi:hypothetical protein|nr:hypothetical protein [Nitrososphaerota archaeon]
MTDSHPILVQAPRGTTVAVGEYYVRQVTLLADSNSFLARALIVPRSQIERDGGIIVGLRYPGPFATLSVMNLLLLQGKLVEVRTDGDSQPYVHKVQTLFGEEFNKALSVDYQSRKP